MFNLHTVFYGLICGSEWLRGDLLFDPKVPSADGMHLPADAQAWLRENGYLWVQTLAHKNIVCFALDRMSNLQISAETFLLPADFNLAERLQYCFGIISPNAAEPSEVILSFEPFQGQYIKSLPLHHTQDILIDNEDELRISLKIFTSFDFVQELLSYGATVKILQPQGLIEEIKDIYERASEKY